MTTTSPNLSPERARSRARLWTWIAVLGTPVCLAAVLAFVQWQGRGDYLWLGAPAALRVGVSLDAGLGEFFRSAEGSVGLDLRNAKWIGSDICEPSFVPIHVEFSATSKLKRSTVHPRFFVATDPISGGAASGDHPILLEKYPRGSLSRFLNATSGAERLAAADALRRAFPERSTPLYWQIAALFETGNAKEARHLLDAGRRVFQDDPTPLGGAYLKELDDAFALLPKEFALSPQQGLSLFYLPSFYPVFREGEPFESFPSVSWPEGYEFTPRQARQYAPHGGDPEICESIVYDYAPAPGAALAARVARMTHE